MPKKRYISDGFWSDSWIENLEPLEKYLYLYLLTNEHLSICGIYEISQKRIAYETGLDIDTINTILQKFEKDGKIVYRDGIIFIINFVKNQNITSTNDNLWKGIVREYEEISEEKKQKIRLAIAENEHLRRSLEGAYKDLARTSEYLTLLNLTLLNLTYQNNSGFSNDNNHKTSSKENQQKEQPTPHSPPPTEFEKVFNDFVEMRKKIKHPLTDRGKQLILDKLIKISKNEKEKIEILQNSIINSRRGVFPIKNTTFTSSNINDKPKPGHISTTGFADMIVGDDDE